MAKKEQYQAKGKVWLWPAECGVSWHFVTLPKEVGAEIKEKYGKGRRGFGSVPVEVTLGETTWKTSVFPDKHSGSYVLPLKAAVRKSEDVMAEDTISFSFVIAA